MGEKNGSLLVLAIVVSVGLLLLPTLSSALEGFASGVTEQMNTLIPSSGGSGE